MKRPEFLETKRTPRYSLRKLHVGVASVLLGVTIFGINFTDHSVKAATTTEAVANTKNSNSTSNSVQTNPQQTENTATTYANKNNAQTAATQQDSAKDVAAGNNTTSQTTSNKHSDATTVNTDSLTTSAKAARTAATILMAASTGTGTDRNASGTVDQNNINTQLAKENQELANKANLTSSDNYSSNIYKGTDGNYYKIVTIYGNDYVYHAADIQASGADLQGHPKQTAEDTKNNINISKEDLGNGQTRWTVTFFPKRGLQNVGSKLSGLSNAKFGIALTSDYQIVGNVDMKVISDPNQSFMSHTFEPGSTSATNFPIQNLSAEKDFSFNPKTDVDPHTGLINSETMPAYNNQYLQGPYYFTTATDTGAKNLWQTYFKDADERKNAYDGSYYLGGNHDFHFNTFKITNKTGVDGAEYEDPIIYDKLGYRLNSKNGVANSNGVFSSDNFNQAMEFKSQGNTGDGQTQFSSYVISFTTQHTDSHEVELATGSNNQQFSGISANIYSYQNWYYNMHSSLYGEQRALDPAGAPVEAKNIIPHWGDVKPYMDKIKQDYLNNAQINVLRNKMLNNITDPDALNNIVSEGNSLNDAMKNLGNSIGQYDPDGSFANHKVDTTKASDRYQYADSDKKLAYDNATDAVSNIISVENGTVNKNKGTYADLATVEKLTTDENTAWSALDGVKPKDNEVNSPIGGTITIEKGHTLDSTDAANAITNKGSLTNVKSYSWSGTPDTSKPGSISPEVIVKYSDDTADNVPVTVKITGDANNYNPEGGEITVNRNTKLGPTEAEEAIKSVQSLPKGTTYSWAGEKLPDTSTSGQKNGWVVVTYPDTSRDIVLVKINVKTDAESYTVTPKDKVSVDKGEDVDPSSLVNVTGPDGKPTTLPAGSIDWKDGAKPDLTTSGNKAGTVEVTFTDGSTKDVPVKVHVKTDAETYDPQAQPWTTTVGKTPKADEVISSTDKNGKKMPSDAKYTWKTEPNTSKIGEASGEVTVTYDDGSHDDVSVTINVKDKLDDNEKYHIYGKDGLNVNKGETLDPKDAIDVKDADGNKTTLPENSKVEWTKEPDFSQAGKDVTGEVTVTYPGPDGSKSDPVTVTVHVNGESDEYKVAPKDNVIVPRGSQVDPESTVVAQTPDGKPTSFPDGTKHEWITKPDTDSTGKRTGVVKTTFPDGSTTTTTVSVTVEPNQSDKYDPKGPKNPDDRVPVKDPEHLTDGDKDKVKDEVGKVNPDLPKDTEVTVDDKGKATITYPDGSEDTIPGGDLVRPEKDADKYDPKGPKNPDDRVPVKDPEHLTDGDKDKVKDEVGKVNPDLPKDTEVTVDDKGKVTITYPDGSEDTIPGGDLVRPEKDADKYDPKGPKNPDDRVPVKDPEHLTDGDKDKVKDEVGKVNPDLPKDTEVTVDDKGKATITYPDGSKDTIPGGDLVRPEKDADKYDPKGPKNPDDRVPVKDPEHLTDGDKDKVKDEVGKVNPDLPKDTEVTVDDKGKATITYPDGSEDTIPGGDLVRPEKDADKYDPKGPKNPDDRVPVKDPEHLTDGDKDKVKDEVGKVNPDLPKDTEVTVDDKGKATITYPDGSKDTIPGGDLVRPEKDADKYDPKGPKNPDDRVPVKDPEHLTDGDKDKVKDEVGKVNPDLPKDTEVTVDDKGKATITYPDGSEDTIPGGDLVRPEKDADKKDADKYDPKGPKNPDDRVPVKDPEHLTDGDKDKVKDEVGKVNPDLPKDTEVTVDDKGKATITYPDGSEDTIPGGDLVRPEKDADKKDADKYDPKGPKNPDDRVPVKDPEHLTDGDKDKVKDEVGKVNPDLPKDTEVTVDDKGKATITYPDGSKDTISGDKLVKGEDSGSTSGQTDAGNITPKVPETKVPVADPSHLTDTENGEVKKNVEDANKGNFPDGTEITVGDDGTATIKYPDGSKDTIPGDQLVQGQKGDTTDAGNITPTIPGDKVTVKDPSHLTDDEKNQVKNNVDNANKDKFPAGTEVTVGDDGTATIKYPDGSKDTIPGDQLVQGQKGDTTDAGNITPTIPGDKVTVKDPSHLTDDEKNQVKNNVDNANKDKFPAGTEVTVGDDGTATIKYPDGSKDTIPGDQLVQGQKGDTTDAGNITPTIPGGKVTVKDPSHLTDDEKNQVKDNVDNANKDKFPAGTEVTVGDDGTATIKYPDGSKDTIPGDQLVQGQKGDTTDVGNITPTIPGGKVTVKDPSHLTDDEKNQVKNNVDNANKDKFPVGTEVTVGDDGTATIKYPDGSKDTISGDQLVQGQKGDTTDAGNITPTIPGGKVTVKDPSHLTDDEKNQVKDKVDQANPNLPDGTKITVGDDGTTTITYPNGSTNTIPGHDLVTGKTDADKYPLNPGQAVDVVDPNHLTQAEQDQVKEAIRTANPTAPIATITVDAAGNVQVTFADGSTTTLQANLHKHVTEATTGSATKPGAGTNGGQTKGAMATNQTATKQQAQQHLPQTGDQPATWAMLSGLGVAFLGLLGLKKKRED